MGSRGGDGGRCGLGVGGVWECYWVCVGRGGGVGVLLGGQGMMIAVS
jgi:hypothetical protein